MKIDVKRKVVITIEDDDGYEWVQLFRSIIDFASDMTTGSYHLDFCDAFPSSIDRGRAKKIMDDILEAL